MSRVGNNLTQYYLLRGGVTSMVGMTDMIQAQDLDIGDLQQAQLSQYLKSENFSVNARPEFMESLPSQSIRFATLSKANRNNDRTLEKQSTKPFQRYVYH
jgi:hypothetical protein